MKTWILLLFAGLLGMTTAEAQISFYGEWCYSNGELISKTWVSPKGLRSESVDKQTGKKFITLCLLDTKKVYALFEDKKTGFLINDITKFAGTNQMVGLDLVSNEQSHTEYLGEEEVDGRMCKKYYSYRTSINNLTGEAQTENAGLTWIYEPLKHPTIQVASPKNPVVSTIDYKCCATSGKDRNPPICSNCLKVTKSPKCPAVECWNYSRENRARRAKKTSTIPATLSRKKPKK